MDRGLEGIPPRVESPPPSAARVVFNHVIVVLVHSAVCEPASCLICHGRRFPIYKPSSWGVVAIERQWWPGLASSRRD
jgi:hypothetical protein